LNDNNISLNAIGNLDTLPRKIRERLLRAIDDTAKNDRMTLTLALSYSGRWDIIEAAKKLARECSENGMSPDDINQEVFAAQMTTNAMPDPELLIRTSGESRISNFLLWQLAYSEFYFTPKLWPDFRREDLFEAIYDYQHRERRFGKTSEQFVKEDK
jgi:undecaprenyl diphosphate synthase